MLNSEALEALKTTGEYESFVTAFTKAAYKVESDDNSELGQFRATNSTHNFYTVFTEKGVELTANTTAEQFVSKWQLESFGYGENQTSAGAGALTASEQRVEIVRDQLGITEWYENKPKGLEHGFIISKRPLSISGKTLPLLLTLRIDGVLTARNALDEQAIELVSKNGQEIMRYTGLKVWDAAGKNIRARMHAASNKVQLEVADKEAIYPLTIDPTFVQRTKLSASDATYNNLFGESIAMSGDTIIIGAPYTGAEESYGRGSAYVFVRSGTTWVEQAKLLSSDGRKGDEFGTGVAIDGDTAIIGAPAADIAAVCQIAEELSCNEGAAYVFVRNGTTWTQRQKLISIDPAPVEFFGRRVEVENGTAVISEHLDDVDSPRSARGRVNIYTRTGDNFALQQRLISESSAVQLFGWGIDLDHDTLIISATQDRAGGTAYVYVRTGSDWGLQQKLVASDREFGSLFGFSVAASGDTIVIGDAFDNINGNSYQGSAYIFTRSGTVWTQRQKLIAANGRTLEHFGYDVGVSNNTVVVSAGYERVGVNDFQGAAYVYIYNGASWSESQKLTAFDGESDTLFGVSVLISGETIIIGALDSADQSPILDTGAVYIFNALSPRRAPFDFDGDGKTDIAVWRPSTRTWWLLRSSNFGSLALQFGLSEDRIVPADYDGDGKTDIAVWRPSTGTWWGINSSNYGYWAAQFGFAGDVPVPADFNGDGRAEITIFRPSNGNWYQIDSITNEIRVTQFGLNGDVPVPADYDGDNRADVAVFRPSTGDWHRINSINNGYFAMHFGSNGDLPAPGDFDGDGRADLNTYRPSTGYWWQMNSSPGCLVVAASKKKKSSTQGFGLPGCIHVTKFGLSEDRPAIGDFNGDGKADISVFRPSDRTWYRLDSPSNTFAAIKFGLTGDVAIPAAFVP